MPACLPAPSCLHLTLPPAAPPPPTCSREKLFNIIIGTFLTFYTGFALLYPHHDTLHLNGLAEHLVQVLPSGLSGACAVRWG